MKYTHTSEDFKALAHNILVYGGAEVCTEALEDLYFTYLGADAAELIYPEGSRLRPQSIYHTVKELKKFINDINGADTEAIMLAFQEFLTNDTAQNTFEILDHMFESFIASDIVRAKPGYPHTVYVTIKDIRDNLTTAEALLNGKKIAAPKSEAAAPAIVEFDNKNKAEKAA
jgi:hypothetical protein